MPIDMQQMMDGVGYQRRDGCNVVTLTKSISDAENASASVEAGELNLEGCC